MTEPHLEPGDRLTCADCGATVVATFSGKWQPGYPVALAWPCGRTEVTHYPPARCLPCHEKAKALGLPDLPPPEPVRGPPAQENAIERFERLAADFQRETGIWPPGKDRPAAMGSDGISDEERMRRWREWCAARVHNQIEHRHAKPKKGTQLALFGGGR